MSDWIDVVVAGRQDIARDIASFTFRRRDNASLPAWAAGAHIDVELSGGLIRQYSLCGAVGDQSYYQIAVLRDDAGRGGSRAIHDQVKAGDALRIGAPRNLFPLVEQQRALLLAGGIGITPILSMAEEMAQQGVDFALHYCVRSAERAAYLDRLNAVGLAGKFTLHCDDQPNTALDAAKLLAAPEMGKHLYVCGPNGFMDHILQTARFVGWPEHKIHFERFTAAAPDPAAANDADAAFEIEIAGSGHVIQVAAGQSALEAMLAAGIDIPASCEQGICGSCLTDVVKGIPDHRDMYLSAQEQAANDCFTPCCSRAKTARLTVSV